MQGTEGHVRTWLVGWPRGRHESILVFFKTAQAPEWRPIKATGAGWGLGLRGGN